MFVNRVGDVTPIRLSVGSERQVGLGSVSDLKDELGNVEAIIPLVSSWACQFLPSLYRKCSMSPAGQIWLDFGCHLIPTRNSEDHDSTNFAMVVLLAKSYL